MKNQFKRIFFGKSTFVNGLIALIVIGLIVLGCTCNGKKFDFGSEGDTTEVDDNNIKIDDDSTNDKDDDSELVAETKVLVKETLKDFKKAVEKEDFEDFLSTTSKDFQYQFTNQKLKTEFISFTSKKDKLVPVLESAISKDITITSEPNIKKQKGQNGKTYQILYVKGEYPSYPKTYIDNQYVLEGKKWKLLLISVEVR